MRQDLKVSHRLNKDDIVHRVQPNTRVGQELIRVRQNEVSHRLNKDDIVQRVQTNNRVVTSQDYTG